MKKIITGFLALFFTISLVACSSKESERITNRGKKETQDVGDSIQSDSETEGLLYFEGSSPGTGEADVE